MSSLNFVKITNTFVIHIEYTSIYLLVILSVLESLWDNSIFLEISFGSIKKVPHFDLGTGWAN